MYKQYEAEWSDVLTNTTYPFVKLDNKVIKAASLLHARRVYLRSVTSTGIGLELQFYNDQEQFVGKTTCGYQDAYSRVLSASGEVVGFVELGIPDVNLYTLTYTFEQSEILPCCINFDDPNLLSISNLASGYNVNIPVVDNTISFVPGVGLGIGQYCGNEFYDDAIYNINSVTPDGDGNIEWLDEGYMRIYPDVNGNRVVLSATIPAERLDCKRPGIVGPEGPQGPDGPDGEDGKDATEIIMEWDPCIPDITEIDDVEDPEPPEPPEPPDEDPVPDEDSFSEKFHIDDAILLRDHAYLNEDTTTFFYYDYTAHEAFTELRLSGTDIADNLQVGATIPGTYILKILGVQLKDVLTNAVTTEGIYLDNVKSFKKKSATESYLELYTPSPNSDDMLSYVTLKEDGRLLLFSDIKYDNSIYQKSIYAMNKTGRVYEVMWEQTDNYSCILYDLDTEGKSNTFVVTPSAVVYEKSADNNINNALLARYNLLVWPHECITLMTMDYGVGDIWSDYNGITTRQSISPVSGICKEIDYNMVSKISVWYGKPSNITDPAMADRTLIEEFFVGNIIAPATSEVGVQILTDGTNFIVNDVLNSRSRIEMTMKEKVGVYHSNDLYLTRIHLFWALDREVTYPLLILNNV